MFKVGDKVRRNPEHWEFEKQDCKVSNALGGWSYDIYTKPQEGTIIEIYLPDFLFRILVRWESGYADSYPDTQLVLSVSQSINKANECNCSEPELVLTGFTSVWTVCTKCHKERK